jgi:F-type H+-transporting ATPase subunit gamma
MSGRLSEVKTRIGTVHQLDAVINGMRGSAAARAREARSRLDGIRAYAAAVGGAIREALALASKTEPPPAERNAAKRLVVIALCSEQGFVGAYNERILDAVAGCLKAAGSELLMAGDRGAMLAAERGLPVAWSARLVVHADEVATLASRITDALYSRLEHGLVTQVTLIYAMPAPSAAIDIVNRALLPFDFARFAAAPQAIPPITTLPPRQLLAELAEEYVYAELCEAVMLAFAAENEARMRAMTVARDNVAHKLGELIGSFRRLRQDEITDDIIELSAGIVSAAPTKAGRGLSAFTKEIPFK